jgi:hypothetical protein
MLLRREAVETARVPVLKREARAQGALLNYFTHQLGYVFFATRFPSTVASALHLSFPLRCNPANHR